MRQLRYLLPALALVALLAPASADASRVGRDLKQLARSGAYPAAQVREWRRDWSRAVHGVRKLDGSARDNLRGVIRNTGSLARRHKLRGRAPLAFLTVHNNVEWFVKNDGGSQAYGTRREFGGTELVWSFYPGSGWQLQQLGSVGHLNGLLSSKRKSRLRRAQALGDLLLSLSVERGGRYRALEYLFPFSGGAPGWVSAMTQTTAMVAFADLWKRTGDQRYLDAAKELRGALQHRPPLGTRLARGKGRAWFLQYSQDRRLLVGNAQAQVIRALHLYLERVDDPAAKRLYDEALRSAKRMFPRFDTGSWSLYYRRPHGPGRESDLHYHELFTSFLDDLCDEIGEFCGMAANFHRYEKEPIEIRGLRFGIGHRHVAARMRLSKRGTVTVSLWRGKKLLERDVRAVWRGGERFSFVRPRRGGTLRVTVDATSLNGIGSSAERSKRVRSLRRHR